MEYEEQLEKLLKEYKLHEVLESHLKQFKSDDDIVRLPIADNNFSKIDNLLELSDSIEFLKTKEQREREVRKQAEDLFNSDDTFKKEYIMNLVSYEKKSIYTDKDKFIKDCVDTSNNLTSLLTTLLTPETLEYLRRETEGITDEKLLKLFDLSIEGSYAYLDYKRFNILVSLYKAKQTAGLKNGIVKMLKENILHDLKSRKAFGVDDYQKAYNDYSIDDDTLTKLAEAKLEEHLNYNLFEDYEYKVLLVLCGDSKNILKITQTYPNFYKEGNGRVNRTIRTNTFDSFFGQGEARVKKSEKSHDIDGDFRFFSYIKNPNLSEKEGDDKKEMVIASINALNEKYKDFNNKMTIFDNIMNAIGSKMTSQDNTLTRDAVLTGRSTTSSPVYITPTTIYKFIKGDRGAKPPVSFENDCETALALASETWVEINNMRGDKSLTIQSRLLDYEIQTVKMNGKETKAYVFEKLPAIYRYNMINDDMTIREMRSDKDSPSMIKSSNYAKTIYDFLLRWCDRYETNKRPSAEYKYDNVIKESGITLDIDSTTQIARNNRKKLLVYVDRALEELKRIGVIKDYTKRIETEESKYHSGKRKYYKLKVIFKDDKKS